MMYNININRVGEILANKLPDQEVEELQARALSLLSQYDSNEKAKKSRNNPKAEGAR